MTEESAPDLQQAMALHQEGRLAEAEKLYRDILHHDPTDADTWHLLGILALQSGRPEPSAALIARAIELNDRIAAAYSNRAIALRRLGRRTEALASLDGAIALEPGNADAHYNRGILLRQFGRLDEALASYDTALTLRPDSAETHLSRGNVLSDLGRFDDALASYD